MQFSLGLAVFIHLVWLFIVHFSFSFIFSPSLYLFSCLPFKFLRNFFGEYCLVMLLKSRQKQDTKYNRLLIFLLHTFDHTILEWTYTMNRILLSHLPFISLFYLPLPRIDIILSAKKKDEKENVERDTSNTQHMKQESKLRLHIFGIFERSMTYGMGKGV